MGEVVSLKLIIFDLIKYNLYVFNIIVLLVRVLE